MQKFLLCTLFFINAGMLKCLLKFSLVQGLPSIAGKFIFYRKQHAMVRTTSIFLLFVLASDFCIAQAIDLVELRGRVLNTATGETVAFATITLKGRETVVMSNEKGEFIIRVANVRPVDSIIVTHVGYRPLTLAVATMMKIELTPKETDLAQVIVKVPDAAAIIKKAISSIPENYSETSYITNGFYRLTGTGNGSVVHMSEAAFDIYNAGYTQKDKRVKIRKARFDKDLTAFNGNDEFNFGTSPEDLLDADIISFATAANFISKDGMKLYNFRYKGTTEYNGSTALVIHFDQKDHVKKALHQGEVYIDAESFAFLEFNYRMSPKGLRYWSIGAAKKLILRLAAIKIDMLQDSNRITYRKYGDKYYLNHAQGNALWRVVGGRDHFELDPLHMKYNYIVTSIDTAGVEPFAEEELARPSKFVESTALMNKGDTADLFWQPYNILLPDFNVDSAAKIIRQNNARLNLKSDIERRLEKIKGSSSVRIDSIFSYYHAHNRFNGNALILYKGNTVYERSFGMANKETNLANEASTAFRIGSASKSFTAAVIMQLVAANKLSTEDSVGRFLPGYKHGYITIAQLLTHQSGIPNYTDNEEHLASVVTNRFTTRQLVDSFCGDSLEFAPGTDFHYSNSGYVVLAAILETITGKSYAQTLSDSIFSPLGMKDSYFGSTGDSHVKVAVGYVNETPEMTFPVENIVGAGGITTTASDLRLYVQALADNKLLPAVHRSALLLPRVNWKEWKADYAYGWMIDRGVFSASKKHVIEYHPGTEPGFYTMLLRQPDKGIIIILLNNKGDFPRFEMTDLILDQLN